VGIEFIAKICFWAGAAALVYTYAGYPLVVAAVSRWRPRPVKSRAGWTPGVSVIITAYNEERDLAAKLENTLALDYPPDKLEVIVASDCSTDRTDDIARAFASRGVRLHRQPERFGKTAAQNAAVERAHGEIILFSDATTLYQPDVLRVLMPNFADAGVGCAAGRLIYVDPAASSVGQGARSYWGYETFLKKHESRTGSLIGVSGCLYAVRRAAYVPLYNEACSDFIIATKMVEQGLRTIYEPAAVCTEETNSRTDRELRMRVRVITQTFTDLWRHRAMMNPLRSGFYAVQLLSHKALRYAVPIFLLVIFIASLVLAPRSSFYALVALLQVSFYLAALVSWALERRGVRVRLLAIPQYFVIANLASLLALYQFLRGERYARWEPIREPAAEPALTMKISEAQGKERVSAQLERPSAGTIAATAAPAVSIIMPAYNVARYIAGALDSVFAQTFADYEIIVVNDGSPDTTELERVLAPYLTRIVYLRQENRGVSGARNTGIRAARGRFIALLDPDDIWEPDYLAVQVAHMEREPAIDVLYANALIFGEGPDVGREMMDLSPSEGEVTFEHLVSQQCTVLVSVIARRRVILRAGLFDESIRSAEEFDLWLRILKQGGRIAYHRRVLWHYRRHAGGQSADPVWMLEHGLKVLNKAERTLTLTPDEQHALTQQTRRYHALLKLHKGKKAFLSGDVETAIENLTEANIYFATRKLTVALWLLRLAPGLLRRAYQWRDRYIFKTESF